MDNKSTHLIEADLESQRWIERYAEIKNLSIQETLVRMLRAGRSALEKQALEERYSKNPDVELAPRVKLGIQATVECLAILRKVHLPDIDSQKRLALEVKQLIDQAIQSNQEASS